MEKQKGSSYSHILKYTGLFGGVQGVSILISIVRNKLVALILGPQGVGLISLFNSTVKLVSDSSNLGLSMSAVKNISEAYESNDESRIVRTVSTIRLWSLFTALTGMFLCVVLSPLLDSWTFNWGNHVLHFILLSPIVFLMAITGGETAILKGTRRLKSLAIVSLLNVVVALLTSIPLYFLWGEKAIVPSLVIAALSQMLLTIAHSYRAFPLRLSFSRGAVTDGYGMVRLGIAFVLAGILGSGADFIIRSYLNNVASLEDVGLYNAGYMMTMVYAGVVFSAMETDFFPRLSAVNSDTDQLNLVVNRQIEVSLLLISPMLVGFIVGLPVLLPLFYTRHFMPAIGMVQVMSLALYFRAMKLPLSYIPLAKADSMSYLFLEMIYDVSIVVMVVLMYRSYGLRGAGFAITITGVLEYLVLLGFMQLKYGYKLSRDVLRYACMQVPLGIITFLAVCNLQGVNYWLAGGILIVASSVVSVVVLRSKTSLWASLVNKVIKKIHGR